MFYIPCTKEFIDFICDKITPAGSFRASNNMEVAPDV